MCLFKTKEKVSALPFISQKIWTAISAISSTFKFGFIFALSPYGETLLVANSIHLSLISNLLTHAAEYI